VPIQIVSLSLEVGLHKHIYLGIASPTLCCEDPDDYGIRIVQKGENKGDGCKQKIEAYLHKTLPHLKEKERQTLEPVLRKYCHLFYRAGSTDLSLQVEFIMLERQRTLDPYRKPRTGFPMR
jgi:hypothetical protein